MESINKTHESMKTISTLVEGIVSGSKDQNATIQNIVDELSQFENITQSVVATSEETAAASQEMLSMSDSLKSNVEQLEMIFKGKS